MNRSMVLLSIILSAVVLTVGLIITIIAAKNPSFMNSSPKEFSKDSFRDEEILYRKGVVAEVRKSLGDLESEQIKANLNRLEGILNQEENNKLIDETLKLIEEKDPDIAMEAELFFNMIKIKWEPDIEKTNRGRMLYKRLCMTCHGLNGDGKPITPESLAVFPRDLTGKSHINKEVKIKFSSAKDLKTPALDRDLKETIREGLAGTPMPGFSQLSDDEIDSIIEYIKTFGYLYWKYNYSQEPALSKIPDPAPDLLYSSKRIEEGRKIFKANCSACHGDIEYGGEPARDKTLEWLDNGKPIPVIPRNFAIEPLKKPKPRQQFRIIRLGIKGTPMPAVKISDDETWNVVAYIYYLQKQARENKLPLRKE